MKCIAKISLLISVFSLVSAIAARAETFGDVAAAATGAVVGCAAGAVPGAIVGTLPAVAFGKTEKLKATIWFGFVGAGCVAGGAGVGNYAYVEQQKAEAAVEAELQQREEAPAPRDP